MPRAFTDDEKDRIRERLLAEGERLFTVHGLAKVNVAELAAAAGISKGAFYLFYDSKETLYMAVMQQVEDRHHAVVLAAVDRPGSSRERLTAVLSEAFSIMRTSPLLKMFSRGDYEQLYRRVSADVLQEHMTSDESFAQTLIDRCRSAGIPVQTNARDLSRLLYAILFASLHKDDFGPDALDGTIDLLLRLTVAYCLGEAVMPVSSEENES